jgi:hypothetical protein
LNRIGLVQDSDMQGISWETLIVQYGDSHHH